MILQDYKSPFAGKKLQDYLYKTKKFQDLNDSVKFFFFSLLEIADWGTYSFFLSYENYIKFGYNTTISKKTYFRHKENLKKVGLLQQLSKGYGGFGQGVGQCSEYRICIENIDGEYEGFKASRVYFNSIDEQGYTEKLEEYYQKFHKINIIETMKINQLKFKGVYNE